MQRERRRAKAELDVEKLAREGRQSKTELPVLEKLDKVGRQAKAELPVVKDWRGREGKLRQNYL